MPSSKHDTRKRAVIKPGRVVPGSTASKSTHGVSALVQWGLKRSTSVGSAYYRPSQDLYPSNPSANPSEETVPFGDVLDVLGTVWPRTGIAGRSNSSAHVVHETPMLFRSRSKDHLRAISQSHGGTEKRIHSISIDPGLPGGLTAAGGKENGHKLEYVRRGSQLSIQGPGDDFDGHMSEPDFEDASGQRQPPPLTVEVDQSPLHPEAEISEPPSSEKPPHMTTPKFTAVRSDTYLLNTMIALPAPSEDEKTKEIAVLKSRLEEETRARRNCELQITQLLELMDTLDSISERLDGVNGCLHKVRKRFRKQKGLMINGQLTPNSTQSEVGSYPLKQSSPTAAGSASQSSPTAKGGDGVRFIGERTLIPHPPDASEAPHPPTMHSSSSDDDDGLQSGEVTPSVCSEEEDDGDLSPLSLTTEDSMGSRNPADTGSGLLPVARRIKRDGHRLMKTIAASSANKVLGRLSKGRSWRGRWGKVRESFDVWIDYQQNCEASPTDSLDLLRTALLRHGCGMEKPKLQRLLNDVGMVAGSHLEYRDYLEIVRQAFAQRKQEHWIRSLKLNELVDTVIHDCLEMDVLSPDGVFNIDERQAAKVFRELKRRAIKEVANLNLQAERLILNPQKSLDIPSCNSKFAMNTVTGSFGDLSQFFDGLDKHIGLPNPRIMKAMEMEHLYCEDSDDFFITTNYNGTRTKPKIEWDFALNPNPNVVYPGVGQGEDGRQVAPLKRFLEHPYKARAMLTDAEVLALRLYTGPMFMKYNTCLRKQPADLFQDLKGNTYTTTIHAIVSGIIKLSKIWTLPEDRKLFRGLGGMLLPQVFWVPDEFGCRGGVELGLLSMTTNREIALQYSGKSDFRPTVFEIDVGQVDRGASVNWLSQYPSEEEVLMPPLSNLEVVGAPRMEMVDGVEVMIVPLRVNVNIKSLTMDELIGRRMTLHMQMSRTIREETLQELREEMQAMRHKASMVGVVDRAVFERDVDDIVDDFDQLLKEHETLPADWYNDDEHYRSAIADIVGMKRLALIKWHLLQEHRNDKMSVMHTFDNSRAISGEALLHRIRETRCQEFANEGVLYRLRSGYDNFPWEDIINRKLSEVELPSDMEAEQVILAWKCLEQIKEVLQKVYIQGAAYRQLFDKVLDFSNRRPPMQSRGISIVTGLMQVNTSVQQLKLNHCVVQDDGARTLANGLLFIPELQRLELSSADIGTPGMKSLCNTLTRMTNLEVLLLHDNHIGDVGATSIAKGLKGMTQLTQLDLSKNNLRTNGAQELARSISRLSGLALEHLNVSDNRIDEDGAIQIAQCVGYLTGLHTLNLNKTFNFTMEVGKHIRDIVPPTVKIYGIGEHALAEHELLSEHQLAKNIRPGYRDADESPKKEGMFFQREQVFTLDMRRRKSSTTDEY